MKLLDKKFPKTKAFSNLLQAQNFYTFQPIMWFACSYTMLPFVHITDQIYIYIYYSQSRGWIVPTLCSHSSKLETKYLYILQPIMWLDCSYTMLSFLQIRDQIIISIIANHVVGLFLHYALIHRNYRLDILSIIANHVVGLFQHYALIH